MAKSVKYLLKCIKRLRENTKRAILFRGKNVAVQQVGGFSSDTAGKSYRSAEKFIVNDDVKWFIAYQREETESYEKTILGGYYE